MDVILKEVAQDNYKNILSLGVAGYQLNYIESTEDCMLEAGQIKEWRPKGIYDGEQLVGFAMYGKLADEDRVWLDRLMIDVNYQGRGYGEAALKKLMILIFKEYDCDKIYLSLYDDNRVALKLYQKIGFSYTGELDTKGEKIMVLSKIKYCAKVQQGLKGKDFRSER